MASSTTAFGSGVSTTALGLSSLKPSPTVGVATIIFPKPRRLSAMVVRAEGQTINPEIRKTEEKVVDSVVVTELSKPLTAYCRCWRSGTFPLCDGGHVKHNKATGDNVGPLLLKKHYVFLRIPSAAKQYWYSLHLVFKANDESIVY
ncbi:hypothetical protein Golob_016298 [Gossypium lobatum]|uniref:Iron-binding zinc finger CDGSH type domain-containing protein n=1 Tax=Gossypium lobatum TaxID=34289 RepID=A0A7J8M471_9ROSI|nr:hypothetical protein [Gossypium lobatum]